MKSYSLVGVDGNVFNIMGYVKNAMEKSGHHLGYKTREERRNWIDKYLDDSMSGSYYQCVMKSQDILNQLNDQMREDGIMFDEDYDE